MRKTRRVVIEYDFDEDVESVDWNEILEHTFYYADVTWNVVSVTDAGDKPWKPGRY